MRIHLLIGAIAMFALPGCVTSSSSANNLTTSSNQGCEIGKKIPMYNSDEYRIEVLSVMENARALQVLDGRAAGDASLQLYEDVKAGKIPRLDADGTITITVDGIKHAEAPSKISYAIGNDICQGSVPVMQTERGIAVTLPAKAGEGLGQTSLILPRGLATARKDILVCITSSFDIYAPTLTAGAYRGKKNTICGLPGSKPGTTQVSELAAAGKKWTMFSLVKMRSGDKVASLN